MTLDQRKHLGDAHVATQLGRPVTVVDALPIVEARALEALSAQAVGSTA